MLKIPPANACVRTGNSEVIARFEIVYKTASGLHEIGHTVGRERDERHCPERSTPITPFNIHVSEYNGRDSGTDSSCKREVIRFHFRYE